MHGVAAVLRSIAHFLYAFLTRIVSWIRSLVRRRGKSAIDTAKLIDVVCRSADECRVVFRRVVVYPNAYTITTSVDTYNTLKGLGDIATSELENELRLHVQRKGGTLGETYFSFVPDKSLADDDFVVACSTRSGGPATEQLVGTLKFTQDNVDVRKEQIASEAPQEEVADTPVRPAPASRPDRRSRTSSTVVQHGGGRQWG